MSGNEAERLTNQQASPWYVCDYCRSEWRSPISAAMCCDAISNDLGYD
jgi:hypothetical protein